MRWLKKTRGCGVVFREHSAGWEHPDALGFRAGSSIMVECKVSRADFFADRNKVSRVGMSLEFEQRPAQECWYLTPPALVEANELPSGWGLLEAHPRLVKAVIKADRTKPRSAQAIQHEVYRLYCEVRRYQIHGLTYPKLTLKSESDGSETP